MLKATKKRARTAKSGGTSPALQLALRGVLLPLLLTLATAFLLLLLAAAVLMRTRDPSHFPIALPVVLMLLCSVLGGVFAVRCNRLAHPVTAALPVGLSLLLLLWLISLPLKGCAPCGTAATLALRALTPVLAVLGGLMARPKAKKRRRRAR